MATETGKGGRLLREVMGLVACPLAAIAILAGLHTLCLARPAEAQRITPPPPNGGGATTPKERTITSFKPVRLVYRQTGGEEFRKPTGISVDRETGEVLVADSGSGLVTLLSRDGVPIHSFGFNGEAPTPTKAVMDRQGRIFVLAGAPRRVKVFSYRGEPLGDFGFPGFEGADRAVPTALAVDLSGNLYIADITSGRILVYDPEGRLTMSFGKRGQGPGAFSNVSAIAVDASGTIYVADAQHQPAIQVFDPRGTFLRCLLYTSPSPRD